MIRTLAFLTLSMLLGEPAFAANPELICDSDARIQFRDPSLGRREVRLEGGQTRAFAWPREPRAVNAGFLKDTGDDEALAGIPDELTLQAFPSPRGTLYLDPTLLTGVEADGIAILAELGQYEVLHCRSR